MCIVNPMHNLLLGTAKRLMKKWMALEILDEKKLISVQKAVDGFMTPTDIGCVSLKIASKFSGFTAEQWKCWVLYFSSPPLSENHDKILTRFHVWVLQDSELDSCIVPALIMHGSCLKMRQ